MPVGTEVTHSKVEHKGRTQIPADIRKYLKLEDGDVIVWLLQEGSSVEVRKGHLRVETC